MNYELVVYTRCMMNYGYLVWDVKRRLLSSIEKASRLLGYEPQTGFEDGLTRVHVWGIENWRIEKGVLSFDYQKTFLSESFRNFTKETCFCEAKKFLS